MRLIVGVTGASGVIMSYHLLKTLKSIDGVEVHLIVTGGAKTTWDYEVKKPISDILKLADYVYEENDMAARISSGSFVTDGMIIMPCSMKTVAGIVSGYADNLVLRAADVCLKENRKVVIIPREMPFGKVHLRNLKEASELGCIIIPPVLTFYNEPETIEDMIRHIIGKTLMQFGIDMDGFRPWK